METCKCDVLAVKVHFRWSLTKFIRRASFCQMALGSSWGKNLFLGPPPTFTITVSWIEDQVGCLSETLMYIKIGWTMQSKIRRLLERVWASEWGRNENCLKSQKSPSVTYTPQSFAQNAPVGEDETAEVQKTSNLKTLSLQKYCSSCYRAIKNEVSKFKNRWSPFVCSCDLFSKQLFNILSTDAPDYFFHPVGTVVNSSHVFLSGARLHFGKSYLINVHTWESIRMPYRRRRRVQFSCGMVENKVR